MSALGTVAAVVILLGVLVLVHELGHFVFARLFDVKVLRFSLGFGPRIFGITFGETEYRLSAVPLGGYVRLLGEDPSDPIPPKDRPRALAAKPLWQRYSVVVAGPLFNLLLALLIYFVHFAGQRTLLPADHRNGAAQPARRECGPVARRPRRQRRRAADPLLGRARLDHLDVGREDAAVCDPARARR